MVKMVKMGTVGGNLTNMSDWLIDSNGLFPTLKCYEWHALPCMMAVGDRARLLSRTDLNSVQAQACGRARAGVRACVLLTTMTSYFIRYTVNVVPLCSYKHFLAGASSLSHNYNITLFFPS